MEIRQRIINSCRELALKKGFRQLTVEEIAQSAGITKRTVYRRFRSKDEILTACVDDFLQTVGQHSDALLTSAQDIPIIAEQILSYLIAGEKTIISQRTLEDLHRYYPQLWQKIAHFRTERISLMLDLAQQQYSHKLSIDPLILSTIISASIQSVLNPEFLIQNDLTFKEAATQLTAVFSPLFSSSS